MKWKWSRDRDKRKPDQNEIGSNKIEPFILGPCLTIYSHNLRHYATRTHIKCSWLQSDGSWLVHRYESNMPDVLVLGELVEIVRAMQPASLDVMNGDEGGLVVNVWQLLVSRAQSRPPDLHVEMHHEHVR